MTDIKEASTQFYMAAAAEWQNLRNKNDFWETYAPVSPLEGRERRDFLLHDLRNILSPNLMRISMYTEATQAQMEPIYAVNEQIGSKEGAVDIDQLNKLVYGIGALPSGPSENAYTLYGKNLVDPHLVRLNIFKKMLPTLSASVRFLADPGAFQLQELMQPTITPELLGQYFNARVCTHRAGKLLRGIDLIPAFNLLHNAVKYHDRWQKQHPDSPHARETPIQLHIPEPGSFVIINRSPSGLPKDRDILQAGVHGEDGSSGYGLTIAHLYTQITGSTIEKGSVVMLRNASESSTNETHIVTFWVNPPPINDRFAYAARMERQSPLPRNAILFPSGTASTREAQYA